MNILSHHLISELQRHEIPFQVIGQEVFLEGFGKSGTVTLVMGDPNIDNNDIRISLILKARYGRETRVFDFEDVVSQAWYWYMYTAERNKTFQEGPHPLPEIWKKHFLNQGLCRIEQKVTEVVIPT